MKETCLIKFTHVYDPRNFPVFKFLGLIAYREEEKNVEVINDNCNALWWHLNAVIGRANDIPDRNICRGIVAEREQSSRDFARI